MEPHPHHKVLCITSPGVNVLYFEPKDGGAEMEQRIIEVPHELTEAGLTKAVYVRVDVRRLCSHTVRVATANNEIKEILGTHIKLPLYDTF